MSRERRVLEPGETVIPIIAEVGHSQECSACCQQDASMRYFDFNAQNDQGWYAYGTGDQVAKDDLVLCEECLEEAANELGFIRDERTKERLAIIEANNAVLVKERDKALEYGDRLEDLMASRPKGAIQPDHRVKPTDRQRMAANA